jgi:exopolysaccharide production protein ExoQ
MSSLHNTSSSLVTAFPLGEQRFVKLFMLAFAILLLSAFFVPRFIAYAPGILGLLGALGFRLTFKMWPSIPRKAIMIVIGILALIFASVLWANITPEHGEIALKRAFKIALVLVPALPLFGVMRSMPTLLLKAYAPKFLIPAFLTGAVFLIFDLYSNSLLYSLLRDIPWPDINYNLSGLNRSVLFATVFALTIPALISGYDGQKKKMLLTITAIVMGVILYQTHSQSSHLAFVTGLIAFGLCPAAVRGKIWYILSRSFILIFVASPLIVLWLFSDFAPMISDVSWFQNGYAPNRMEIWDYVARYALDSPIWGHGVDATRVVTEFDSGEIYQPGKTILHPHNFAIQIWIEFGMIGAVVFSVVFGTLFQSIKSIPASLSRATALAVFIALAAAGSTGYGLWQGWWLGTFIMMTSLCLCIIKTTDDQNLSQGLDKKP